MSKSNMLRCQLPDNDPSLDPPPTCRDSEPPPPRSRIAQRIRSVLEENDASDLMQESAIHYGSRGRQRRRPVVELDSKMSPLEAARKLWEGNILGAPVWDEREMRYVGFFDMRAILRVLTASAWDVEGKGGGAGTGTETGTNGHKGGAATDESGASDGAPALPGSSGGGEFRSILVSSLQQMDEEHPTIEKLASLHHFYSCTPQTTLADLCRILSMMGCHRMPAVDHGKVSYIITQSALVEFLSTKLGGEGGWDGLDETLDEAGLEYRKKVVCVRETASASEAFGMLVTHGLSGLAVVDGEGKIVESTSAKDIKRAALDEKRTAMDATILEYLSLVRGAERGGDGEKEEVGGVGVRAWPGSSPCHVTADATVGRVISMLALTNQHRVFVTDKERRPVGVISVTNIINFALDRPQSTLEDDQD